MTRLIARRVSRWEAHVLDAAMPGLCQSLVIFLATETGAAPVEQQAFAWLVLATLPVGLIVWTAAFLYRRLVRAPVVHSCSKRLIDA